MNKEYYKFSTDFGNLSVRTFIADVNEFDALSEWVSSLMEKAGANAVETAKMVLASEEAFVNIAKHTFRNGGGAAELAFSFNASAGVVGLRFSDAGVQYDPLMTPEPDIALPGMARSVGGLGIFMVKKLMSEVAYEYENGYNNLMLFFKLSTLGEYK